MRLSTNVCDYCKTKCDTVGKITIYFKTIPEIAKDGEICYNCAKNLEIKLNEEPEINIKPRQPKPVTRNTVSNETPYMGGIGDH